MNTLVSLEQKVFITSYDQPLFCSGMDIQHCSPSEFPTAECNPLNYLALTNSSKARLLAIVG